MPTPAKLYGVSAHELHPALSEFPEGHSDCGHDGIERHGDDRFDVTFRGGELRVDRNGIDVQHEGNIPVRRMDAGESVCVNAGSFARLQQDPLAVVAHFPHSASAPLSENDNAVSRRSAAQDTIKGETRLINPCSFEQMLEELAEQTNLLLHNRDRQSFLIGREQRVIVLSAEREDESPEREGEDRADCNTSDEKNPIPARPHGFTHNPFSDQCNSFPCGRASITIGAPNKISNRCTIFPTKSPIDAAGVSSTPRDATNSELEGAGITASALAQREPSGDTGLHAPSSKFQSGFSGLNELGRDLPPDNSEKYSSKFISPLFFCLMAKIPTAVVADFDTRQSTEGNRYEHPWFTDTWAEHERAH